MTGVKRRGVRAACAGRALAARRASSWCHCVSISAAFFVSSAALDNPARIVRARASHVSSSSVLATVAANAFLSSCSVCVSEIQEQVCPRTE